MLRIVLPFEIRPGAPQASSMAKTRTIERKSRSFGFAKSVAVPFLTTCLLIAFAARAQTPTATGDPVKGRALALEECIFCHEIKSHRVLPPMLPNAPPFTEIANAKGTTAISLRVFLNSSHKTMPNFILSPYQQRDVISYILSLRSMR